ncbi:hypothetical protein [Undibacterium sp.]|uniref:hypothetical protein n=1 Tax=Undibacterium sp. TaxID=1914977 RepID=UPI0025E4030F|nr:hypothetical protein [Undibacterium sp.]
MFERRNRAVFLTPEGATFKLSCSEVMQQLALGIRQIRQADYQQALVVRLISKVVMSIWLCDTTISSGA